MEASAKLPDVCPEGKDEVKRVPLSSGLSLPTVSLSTLVLKAVSMLASRSAFAVWISFSSLELEPIINKAVLIPARVSAFPPISPISPNLPKELFRLSCISRSASVWDSSKEAPVPVPKRARFHPLKVLFAPSRRFFGRVLVK